MVRVLKLTTPHKVNRAKRNKQLLLCEAPKRSLSLTSPLHALPRALSEYNPGEEGLEKEGTNTQNTSARRNSA